jgi:hypothetical protein
LHRESGTHARRATRSGTKRLFGALVERFLLAAQRAVRNDLPKSKEKGVKKLFAGASITFVVLVLFGILDVRVCVGSAGACSASDEAAPTHASAGRVTT